MKTTIKNHQEIEIKILYNNEFIKLSHYLNDLSDESKHRFGPHGYEMNEIQSFYKDASNLGYIALDSEKRVIAYAILRLGFLNYDKERLENYGLVLSNETDSTFAPSVADAWQSKGIGQLMLRFILDHLKEGRTKRIILWGGVQCSNSKAVNFYKRTGFIELGEFEYYGMNKDMILEIP